jgi:hypothetical protein
LKRTLAATVFATALSMLAAHADTVKFYYEAVPCTPGVDCFITPHGTSPASPAPTNVAFQQFFGTKLGMDLSGDTFSWSQSTNGNGYWFGTVGDGAHGIHTSYLWLGDHFLCCTIDAPYDIVDGNDHNFFIGIDANGVSNAGQPLFPAFIGVPGGTFALTPLDYSVTPDTLALLGGKIDSVRMVAIDDGDRILATWDGGTGWLEFLPAEFTPGVPEPATIWLLAPVALISLRFAARSRTNASRHRSFRFG